MMSADSELKEIQEEFLVALKYFHQICVNNSIHYSMHGGSLLGTIREHGFIPWDDDIDISMTRDEFEKFNKIMKTISLDENYYYDDLSARTPHLCMKRPEKPVVWISVFVYDYISEKKIERKLKIFLIKLTMLCFASKETMQTNKLKKGLKNKIKGHLEYLVWKRGQKIDRRKLIIKYNAFCKNRLVGKKLYIHRSNDTNAYNGIRIVLPQNVMDEYKIVPFENSEVMITTRYHEVLKSSYGDNYMTPIKDETKSELHEILRKRLEK